MNSDMNHTLSKNDDEKQKKVVLSMLPFWTPLIPPQAPAQLKGFVQKHSNHQIKTIDFNVMVEFRQYYSDYFTTLRSFIPEDKCGNFLNVGHDVLQNHMMSHFNYIKKSDYYDLVKEIIYQNYFVLLTEEEITILNGILDSVFHEMEKKLDDIVAKENPDVMGFTAYIHTLPAVVYACKFLKHKYPKIQNVIGGGVFIWELTEGNPDYDYFLEYTKGFIDQIFVGTGQFLLLKYLNGEFDENKRVYTASDIKERVTYDNFVDPDMSDYTLDYYPFIAISGSTSCPFQCSFCSINKYYGEYIKKPAKMVLAEMQRLKEKYHRQMFFMIDSLINPIIDDVSIALLESDVKVYFDGYFRVDDASGDIENTLRWRKAGFYRARIGVESGSQHVLDMMGKRITINQTRASLKALSSAGIKTTTFWVIGHPGETEEDFQMTLDLLEEVKDYIYEAEYNPFYYYYSNQAATDEWTSEAKLLYPEKYRNMLITQTWCLDKNPTRKVMFERVNRFEKRRKELGIPNPYTMEDIYQADQRWKLLHPNAVPDLVDIEKESIHNEKSLVKKIEIADNVADFDEFDFDD